jgi:hypothetical protein
MVQNHGGAVNDPAHIAPETIMLAGETWNIAMVPKVLDASEILKWGELHIENITKSINETGSFVPGLVILGSPKEAMTDTPHGQLTVQLALPILKYIAPQRQEDTPTMVGELTRLVVETLIETESYAIMVAMPAFVPEDAESAKSIAPGGDYKDNEGVVEALVVTTETMEGMMSMRMFAIDREDETNRASIAVELEMNDFQKKLFPRFLEIAVEYAKKAGAKR